MGSKEESSIKTSVNLLSLDTISAPQKKILEEQDITTSEQIQGLDEGHWKRLSKLVNINTSSILAKFRSNAPTTAPAADPEAVETLKRKLSEVTEEKMELQRKFRRFETLWALSSFFSASHIDIYNHAVESEALKTDSSSCMGNVPLVDDTYAGSIWEKLQKEKLTNCECSSEESVQTEMNKIFKILIKERNATLKASVFKYKELVVLTDRRRQLDGAIFYEGDLEGWSTLLLGVEYESPTTTIKEGSGQALSYLSRMMSARLNDDANVNGFAIFSNYTHINIIRCKILKGEAVEYWQTGMKPLFSTKSCSEGFLLLLSLIFANQEALGIAGPPALNYGPKNIKLQERIYCGPFSQVYKIDGGVIKLFRNLMLAKHELVVLGVLSKKNCPNLPQVEELDNKAFIVKPLGTPLPSYVQEKKKLEEDEIKKFGKEILEALKIAHEQGILHADIRPSNILIYEARAILIDWGNAIFTENPLLNPPANPFFVSSRILNGKNKEFSPRDDLEALGYTLCYMKDGIYRHGPATSITVEKERMHQKKESLFLQAVLGLKSNSKINYDELQQCL